MILFVFTDNLWISSNSFLWTTGLKDPLFQVTVARGKTVVNITLTTLLNKTGHCRLTMPFVCPPNDNKSALEIAYSGKLYIFLCNYF